MNKLLFLALLLSSVGCSMTPTQTAPESTPNTSEKPAAVENLSKQSQAVSPSKDCPEVITSNKFTIGQVEYIGLVNEKTGYEARIDTGATTSSIGAFNIVEFERDGKSWVKFTLENTPESKVFEYPIDRISHVTNPGRKKKSRRPVVNMLLSIGDKQYNAEVSLTDRSHMTFKILIGREFMRDRMIVDVSHKHMMKGE